MKTSAVCVTVLLLQFAASFVAAVDLGDPMNPFEASSLTEACAGVATYVLENESEACSQSNCTLMYDGCGSGLCPEESPKEGAGYEVFNSTCASDQTQFHVFLTTEGLDLDYVCTEVCYTDKAASPMLEPDSKSGGMRSVSVGSLVVAWSVAAAAWMALRV